MKSIRVKSLFALALCGVAAPVCGQPTHPAGLNSPRVLLDEVSGFSIPLPAPIGVWKTPVLRISAEDVHPIIREINNINARRDVRAAEILLQKAKTKLSETVAFFESEEQKQRRRDGDDASRTEESSPPQNRRPQEVIRQLELELKELQQHFGNDHPKVQAAQGKLKALRSHREQEHAGVKKVDVQRRESMAKLKSVQAGEVLEVLNSERRQIEEKLDATRDEDGRARLKKLLQSIGQKHEEIRRWMHEQERAHDEHGEVGRDEHHGDFDERNHHDPRQHEHHDQHEGHHEEHNHAAHEDHQDHEHNEHHHSDEDIERIHAVHEAAERLRSVGLDEMADHLHQRAEEMEREIHERRENHGPEAVLHELMENMGQLRREVRELHEKLDRITEKLNRPSAVPATRMREAAPQPKQPLRVPQRPVTPQEN